MKRLIFLFSLLFFQAWPQIPPRPYHILLINSYHPGYRWSDEIVRGFKSELNIANINYKLSIEYMDSKRYPINTIKNDIIKLLQKKYKKAKIDFIITTDDNAYNLILEIKDKFFPGIPIIFGGVNKRDSWEKRGPNITGVLEEVDFTQTLMLIKKVLPEIKNIAVVSDTAKTSTLLSQQFWNSITDCREVFNFIDLTGTNNLLPKLKKLPPQTAIYYLLYLKGEKNHPLSMEESIEIIDRAANVPIFSSWDFVIRAGATGGVATTGHSHGHLMGEILTQIINGKKPNQIEYRGSYQYVTAFNYKKLIQYSIPLNKIPSDAQIYYRPLNPFEENPTLFTVISILFISLLAIIIMLIFNILSRHNAQVALQLQQKRYFDLVQNVPLGIAKITPQGKILFSNNFMNKLFPYNQIIGMDFIDLFSNAEDRLFIGTTIRHWIDGTSKAKIAKRAITKEDGSLLELNISYTLEYSKNNDFKSLVLVIVDMTETKKIYKELDNYRQKYDQLTASSDQIKKDFLAQVVHDLRTPMNAILGFMEVLLENESNQKQREYIQLVQKAGGNLTALINDLLDLSKIESGEMQIESIHFDLNAVGKEVIKLLGLSAMDKSNLNLKYQFDPTIPKLLMGDPHRINQILINLVANAIKFTPKGEVSLKIERKDDQILITVTDTGIGIASDSLKDIFGQYVQEKTTRQYGGTGLGLSICKKLTELMHGKLWAESKIGHGSTFFCQIPLIEADSKSQNSSVHIRKGKNILIVDDSEDNRLLIQAYLKEWPCNIHYASDGFSALKKFKKNPYDLVVMDIKMPGMSGHQATREIRKMNKKVAIVGLSALGSKKEIDKFQSCGGNDFLTKPIHKAQLEQKLDQLLALPKKAAS